jgi:hypothetical protein
MVIDGLLRLEEGQKEIAKGQRKEFAVLAER